jgi:hypothetical protein
MNDVFTPTRNLLLLKNVSYLTFLQKNVPPVNIFIQKDLFGTGMGK